MSSSSTPGPANLEHRYLRSALEFAVGTAEAGLRVRPPLAFPAELKPFFKQHRLPGAALGRLRRAVDANESFRRQVAAAATPELVDPIGMEWLRREDGWEERVAAMVDEATLAAAEDDAVLALKRSERRREAAEQLATRTRAELVALGERVAELEQQLRDRERAWRQLDSELESLRGDVATSRQAVRHASDKREAAQRRLAAVETERDDALALAAAAARQRDELLAARAEAAGVSVTPSQLSEVRALADSARSLADRLARLVAVRPMRREPIAVPGSLVRDPRRATEHVLRAPGVLVLVDGYNVAKLMWPDVPLVEQRERLLDAVDAVARRYGTELAVVFDGADVPGGHTRRRRLARVRYSPGGVIADDVIRDEVAAADASRPIVVVTNDAAVRRDVSAMGANVVTSDAFGALALG